MVMDEFVTAVLGFAVGCAATAALYVGLLGMVGATRVWCAAPPVAIGWSAGLTRPRSARAVDTLCCGTR